eukprot:CAMPEP_0203812898 /NCGR_PEP_ID=MMETSP0115-20131106/4414_1 /ASSEMBLY_ACC=CAM_ASM_000227 /TAXON_ID=33651 /ORGANISM="Bicosoecid sp, Strain ms1" /LENGTH=96 /DNA_ID=CAMNT_0050721753 /DNA_START=69 /DNA_END=359 /DNA_ORIENTATION=+
MQRATVLLAAKAPKGNVPPNMAKWWKAYTPFHGQVTRQVSPFNLNQVSSLFHNAPSKLKHKVTDNIFDVAPALVASIAFYSYAEWKHADIAFHHRD